MSVKTVFYCRECGQKAARWLGRCPACGSWNTFVEEKVDSRLARRPAPAVEKRPLPVTEVPVTAEERHSTGLGEVDRVLGGGLVPGSLVLLGGDPGIGKSTLLLQVAGGVSRAGEKVLYVSGEESARQVRLRAGRLNVLEPLLYLINETDIGVVERVIDEMRPRLVIVDSIQTMCQCEMPSPPGSVAQVRECTARLMQLAKRNEISLFLVGHVTKEGVLAGPRVVEHMVDAVLYLEGDRHRSFRILRGVKNRFGSTNEIGVFEMRGGGLVEVPNPSSLFLMHHSQDAVAGAVVIPTLEGSRPLLVEVQALVCPSGFGVPRRVTTGLDHNRVALIMAVLEKRLGFMMGSCDAYVNAVGGVRITEPAADLGIALALASSFKDVPVDCRTAVVGEVGLTGEIRPVTEVEKRVREAEQLGFARCLVPATDLVLVQSSELEVVGVETLAGALELVLK